MPKYENAGKLPANRKASNFNRGDSKPATRPRPVTTILLSGGTSSFPILTQRSKAKRQSKRKSKRKNNIQLVGRLADGRQPSLKHLSAFTQPADLGLRSRAKRVVDLAEPIPGVSEQSQSQNQSQINIKSKSTSNQPVRRARLPETAPLDSSRLRLSFRSKAATASGALAR